MKVKLLLIICLFVFAEGKAGCAYYATVLWNNQAIYSTATLDGKVLSKQNTWINDTYIGNISFDTLQGNLAMFFPQIDIYVPNGSPVFFNNDTIFPPSIQLVYFGSQYKYCESYATLNIHCFEPWMASHWDSIQQQLQDSIDGKQHTDPTSLINCYVNDQHQLAYSVFENSDLVASVFIINIEGKILFKQKIEVVSLMPYEDKIDLTNFGSGVLLFRYEKPSLSYIRRIFNK